MPLSTPARPSPHLSCHYLKPPPPARRQGVSLALSLHAPTQAQRADIVPSARAYPLDRLMAAVADYQSVSGQRVFVEYVLLAGVNDSEGDAAALGALLAGRDMHVNLIPWVSQ